MEPEVSLPHSQVPATCPCPNYQSRSETFQLNIPQQDAFYGEEFSAPRPTPRSWRTTPCRPSATASPIDSQLPSLSEAVPPSGTWGRAMPWWQGPTDHWSINTTTKIYGVYAANRTEVYILWRHNTLYFCKTAYTRSPLVPSRRPVG